MIVNAVVSALAVATADGTVVVADVTAVIFAAPAVAAVVATTNCYSS